MAKDIFSKIIKDYNNELETIIEKKAFSEDVKNLLLSMLYKIENAYDDYEKVKVNVCKKKQFIEEILETIEKKCNQIEFIKPMSQEGQELYENNINCIINKEEGKIKTFQNEKSILDAIIQMRQENIEVLSKYEIISEPIIDLLLIGNNLNTIEMITDFNGWSWDISIKNTIYSKLYRMLVTLLGNNEIECWVNKRKNEELEELPSNLILSSKYNENFGITKKEIVGEKKDYIEIIKNKFIQLYGEGLTKEFFEKLIKVAILECSKYNKKYEEKILKQIEQLKIKLEKMKDNKLFIEELSLQKKEISKQIEQIDMLLNNERELKQEYEKRNKNLPNKEKIFSVSHLRLMLEKQRNQGIENIKRINKKMEPKEFVKIKNDLEERLKYYQDIKIKDKSEENLQRLQKSLEEIFLKCFEIKIEKAQENKQIENLIYELRYYKLLPPIVYKERTKLENKLIKKACEQRVLTKFTENEKLNFEILKEIFNTRIIDIDTITLMLKYSKGVLTVNIYDGDVEESSFEIEIKEKVELLAKLNKKIKIWQ